MTENKTEEVIEAVTSSEIETETKSESISEKCISLLSPITEKVREIVLGFGEIIVTISVLIGLVTAIIGGLSDILNVGFFAGLSTMLSDIVSVVMGALVIFLLFAIYKKK